MPSSLTPLARSSTLPLQLFLSSQASKPWRLICGICLFPRCLSLSPHHLASLPPSPSALFSVQSLPAARFVAYWHRAFGSPSLSTFRRALKHGFIRGIPHLTHHLVAKYPPLSLSTSFGHLDMLRKGISSSRPKIPPSCLGPVALPLKPVGLAPALLPYTTRFLPTPPELAPFIVVNGPVPTSQVDSLSPHT